MLLCASQYRDDRGLLPVGENSCNAGFLMLRGRRDPFGKVMSLRWHRASLGSGRSSASSPEDSDALELHVRLHRSMAKARLFPITCPY